MEKLLSYHLNNIFWNGLSLFFRDIWLQQYEDWIHYFSHFYNHSQIWRAGICGQEKNNYIYRYMFNDTGIVKHRKNAENILGI